MKSFLLLVAFVGSSLILFSQENAVTLSGGYAFANLEDTDLKTTGWRINGLYEFNPMEGMLSHGIAIGYINTSVEEESIIGKKTYKLNSTPIYYVPKLSFGNEKVKAFVKGAIGLQFSGLKVEGSIVDGNDNDFGFYGGGGAGLVIHINEKLFVNAEYELAWLSNGWYKDGLMNSIMGGIGMRF